MPPKKNFNGGRKRGGAKKFAQNGRPQNAFRLPDRVAKHATDFQVAPGRRFPAPGAPGAPRASESFSMMDEARNTRHDREIWLDHRLRNAPVSFITAGRLNPLADSLALQTQEPEGAKEQVEPAQAVVEQAQASPLKPRMETAQTSDNCLTNIESNGLAMAANFVERPESSKAAAKVVDGATSTKKAGNQNKQAAKSQTRDRSVSSSESEVILFFGRRGGNGRSDHGKKWRHSSGKARAEELEAQQRKDRKKESDAIMADYMENIANETSDKSRSDKSEDQLPTLPFAAFVMRDLGHEQSFDEDSQSVCPVPDDSIAGSDNESQNEKNGESEKAEDSEVPDQAMDDETLARLLSKQDELGIDAEDLVLYDGSTGIGGTKQRKRVSDKQRRLIVNPGEFPDATKLANALDNTILDSDDWAQMDIPKAKGKRGVPPSFEGVDADMQAVLKLAWQKDRLAKAQKKREREELHKTGAFTKGGCDPSDLRAKYSHGMRLVEIVEEIRAFLRSEAERYAAGLGTGCCGVFTLTNFTHTFSLAFCPLDNHGRTVIHKYASKLKLGSKSFGTGLARHTVLSKRKITPPYEEDHFNATIIPKGRPYFARPDVKGPRPNRGTGTQWGAVRYRDGEVVSNSVPEIATDNKGRSMLEKMGWSKGTALGAVHNKGILEPVAQVVKTTKAGLGAAAL